MTYPDPNQPQPQYPTGAPQWAPPISPPPQYGYNQPYYPPQPEPKNGLGITALVCGILGLIVCIIPILGPFVGGPLSVLAITFGAIGVKRAKRGVATNKTMARWGLWLGVVACAWAIGDLIYITTLANHLSNCLDATSTAINNIDNQGAQDAANAACQN